MGHSEDQCPAPPVLALAAISAVMMNWKSARILVWIFSIEGTLDLVAAIALATIWSSRVHGPCVLDPRVLGSCSWPL